MDPVYALRQETSGFTIEFGTPPPQDPYANYNCFVQIALKIIDTVIEFFQMISCGLFSCFQTEEEKAKETVKPHNPKPLNDFVKSLSEAIQAKVPCPTPEQVAKIEAFAQSLLPEQSNEAFTSLSLQHDPSTHTFSVGEHSLQLLPPLVTQYDTRYPLMIASRNTQGCIVSAIYPKLHYNAYPSLNTLHTSLTFTLQDMVSPNPRTLSLQEKEGISNVALYFAKIISHQEATTFKLERLAEGAIIFEISTSADDLNSLCIWGQRCIQISELCSFQQTEDFSVHRATLTFRGYNNTIETYRNLFYPALQKMLPPVTDFDEVTRRAQDFVSDIQSRLESKNLINGSLKTITIQLYIGENCILNIGENCLLISAEFTSGPPLMYSFVVYNGLVKERAVERTVACYRRIYQGRPV